jgi:predicted MFS family arabinose efflux permease
MSRTFWIVSLVNFINSLSVTILIPTIYLYGRSFNLSDVETSFLFAVFSIAQFFATPIIGKLSDRYGRRPLLIISLIGTVVGNLMAWQATPAMVWMLFAGRIIDGITGGNISVAQAIISDVTEPADRAKGFGIFGASLGLGFVMGPVISLFAQKISLGTAFLVAGIVAAIALVVTILFLPETLKQKNLAVKVWDLGFDNLVKGLFMPRIGILLMINFLIGTTFTIFTFAFQPYYTQVLGQSNESLTLLFFTFGLSGVLMQTQGIKLLTKRLSVVKILFLALFSRSLAFFLMPVWPNVYYFWVVAMLFSLFNSFVQPMVSTLISLNSKPDEQGVTAGLNASYLSIANGIGPLIAGVLVDQTRPDTYGHPLYLTGVLTFLVFLFAVKTREQYKPRPILTEA